MKLCCRYVGSGLHGGIKEFLASMNDEEAVGVISNLVRVQAVVGTGAAVREGGRQSAPDCLTCILNAGYQHTFLNTTSWCITAA